MSCAGSKITNQEIIAFLFEIAPQFKTTDSDKLASYNALIDALRCMVNEQALGCCALLAYASLLAHYLTLQNNPVLGVASSLSEGQLSIGMTSTSGEHGFFYSTPYGQQYSQLISRYKIGAYVTNARRNFGGVSCNGC